MDRNLIENIRKEAHRSLINVGVFSAATIILDVLVIVCANLGVPNCLYFLILNFPLGFLTGFNFLRLGFFMHLSDELERNLILHQVLLNKRQNSNTKDLLCR